MGLEAAGFDPVALVESDPHACATLRANRPGWRVLEMDVWEFTARDHPYVYDVDLLAAGLPRVKSPAAVRRAEDGYARELLEAAVWLTTEVRPRSLLIENVPGLVRDSAFTELREFAHRELEHLGYVLSWNTLNASDFGLAQNRRMGLLVAMRADAAGRFRWPEPVPGPPPTVGEALGPSMAARGWCDAEAWAARANRLAPAIVGGSKKRGGADLGPSGTKQAWARMGINGGGVGDEVPDAGYCWEPDGDVKKLPKLTVEQIAVLQGFPPEWMLAGRKTERCRQLGHASPPPVARALGDRIAASFVSDPGR
ncbi:DNA (cytosine-5)-methyltransferase 1 [Streptomyces aidingensis]|uniref:DNA (cytosine-5-)-methyltransferase n=2 Tax=Streptomyces aidingensis TaxID=910347 RepID=A0A1I1TVH8_9ACTN|nr:DNA (cytosine-5)-methyltransferase 1 [Streptomyces aidingensis]